MGVLPSVKTAITSKEANTYKHTQEHYHINTLSHKQNSQAHTWNHSPKKSAQYFSHSRKIKLSCMSSHLL